MTNRKSRVLVTGASGYVGGRLIPELLAKGHAIRCVVRDPRKPDAAFWHREVEMVRAGAAGVKRTASRARCTR